MPDPAVFSPTFRNAIEKERKRLVKVRESAINEAQAAQAALDGIEAAWDRAF